MNDWRIEAETVVRNAFQLDLEALPFYVVDVADCGNFAPAACYGFTSPILDLHLESDLRTTGRWRGRGPCVAVDSAKIANDWGAAADIKRLATVLHELAHCFEHSSDRFSQPCEQWSECEVLAFLDNWLQHEKDPAGVRDERQKAEAAAAPWHLHELPFWRTVAHVAHRAEQAGLHVPSCMIADAARYGLSPLAEYQAALSFEVRLQAGVRIADVLQTDPPEGLQELWDRDTSGWRCGDKAA